MRAALSGLSTRGRSFLAAGLAAALCSVLLGQRDILRIGVLLCALPLLSAAVVARTRYRLACTRTVIPGRVPAGQEASVVVALENVSRLPSGLMLVEDTVPYMLGNRPRFVLDRVEPRGRRELTYPVRSDLRGRFSIGPLSIHLTDPFGMCELTRSFTSRDALIVTPVVEQLPIVHLGGEWAGSGESRARSVSAAGEDDVATREYRHGDDLRRVHWRSTAKQGELMVRREEQPWQSRCTLLLDTRSIAHRGEGMASSFEWAVSAAASIGVHLSRRGYAVRLVLDTGATIASASHDPGFGIGQFEGALLDALAVVQPSGVDTMRTAAESLRRGGGDGLVVAVLGNLHTEEAQHLARVRHGTTSGVCVLLDAATWSRGAARSRRSDPTMFAGSSALLRRSGWRVLEAAAGDTMAQLWPQADRSLSSVELPVSVGRSA
jgi:uncharacterized protein (DUF58 family)